MSNLLSSAKAAALAPARRKGRPVAWTPIFMGFGNLLYVAHWVHLGRDRGEDRWALTSPTFERWLPTFPSLRQFVLTRSDVCFTDQRLKPWSPAAKRQTELQTGDAFDLGHSHEDLRRFVALHLLPPMHESVWTDEKTLVVNVRRGDYFSVPELRGSWAFDVDAYLRIAVPAALEQGEISRIHVISDGIDWCQARLNWLSDLAPLSFSGPDQTPQDHFIAVSTARHVVMTNSTFSYWAAFASNTLHDNHSSIWAPRFFDRSTNKGRSWLLDERWSVVEDIPGGWDS